MSFKSALITGASSGLGRALALFLADQGIPLILAARSLDKLQEISRDIAVPCTLLCADLTKEEGRTKVINCIRSHAPDLVINNAGLGFYGDAMELSTEEQLEMFHVNATAVLEITLEAARTLSQQSRGGTILNVASAAGFFLFPSFSVYAASKSFVIRLSQMLDMELSPLQIRVLVACPGQIDTPFRLKASKGRSHERSSLSMPVEKAVHAIWKQIRSGKRLNLFDEKTAFLVWLARFFPCGSLLRRSVRKRMDT